MVWPSVLLALYLIFNWAQIACGGGEAEGEEEEAEGDEEAEEPQSAEVTSGQLPPSALIQRVRVNVRVRVRVRLPPSALIESLTCGLDTDHARTVLAPSLCPHLHTPS